MNYSSTLTYEAKFGEGIRFTIRRISFGLRLELLAKVHSLTAKLECMNAGISLADRSSSAALEKQLQRLYLESILLTVEGLLIDDEAPTPASLFDRGPEGLVSEVIDAIQVQLGLTEEERKN